MLFGLDYTLILLHKCSDCAITWIHFRCLFSVDTTFAMAPKRKVTTQRKAKKSKTGASAPSTGVSTTQDDIMATMAKNISLLTQKVLDLEEKLAKNCASSVVDAGSFVGSSGNSDTAITTSATSTSVSPGVCLGSVPNVVILPPEMKANIRSQQNINLAALLIAAGSDENFTTAPRTIEVGGQSIELKPLKDHRLYRMLTLSEFVRAFSIYRDELCESFPHKRKEFDAYMSFIVGLSQQFGGGVFYNYHLKFSKKAAYYTNVLNVNVDWSKPDDGIRNEVTSGKRINSCGLCGSIEHDAHFCQLASSSKPHDKREQVSKTWKCKSFNSPKGCTFKQCKYDHSCMICESPHHSSGQCKKSTPEHNKNGASSK